MSPGFDDCFLNKIMGVCFTFRACCSVRIVKGVEMDCDRRFFQSEFGESLISELAVHAISRYKRHRFAFLSN